MLTADLVRSRLRQRGSELTIDMLDIHDSYWLSTATELIALALFFAWLVLDPRNPHRKGTRLRAAADVGASKGQVSRLTEENAGTT